MFVKSRIRKSLVAKMVGELLDTRVMVKSSMKAVSDDEVSVSCQSRRLWRLTLLTQALLKLLNARQLALKFLANVTYG
jgi:DNA polymerase zeta